MEPVRARDNTVCKNGYRTFQIQTFQSIALILDFLTPDYYGIENFMFEKSSVEKSRVEKSTVEKPRVEMSRL